VILDNLGIHTPKGSLLLRGLLAELREELVLVYTPTYDPDANPDRVAVACPAPCGHPHPSA
jgi:transposase